MSCEQRDELLNAMVDGQLGADARRSLETHLLDCPGCRARRDALEALRRDLEAAFAPESRFAADLAERVAARYEKAPATSFPWRRAAALALAAAAGVLIAVLFRPATPPPVVDTREKAAWEALQAVHAFSRQNPQDHAGFLKRCFEFSEKHSGTAAAAAATAAARDNAHLCKAPLDTAALDLARKELGEALERAKAAEARANAREDVDAELARLDEELNGPLSREEFGRARDLLDAAKKRRAEPRWAGEVDRRIDLLGARITAVSLSCAGAAKANPGTAKVHRDRVAGWGVGDALAAFDRDVGPIAEPVPAAAEKGMLTLAAIGDLLVKGPAPRTGERVEPPLFVATREGAYCAFRTEGGDVLRVNAGTRVQFMGDRILLDQGELFVQAKGAVEIACGGQKVSARNATFEVSLRDQARMVKGPGRTELRVLVLNGEAKVDGRAVAAGELCKAVNGAFEPAGPAEHVVLQTQWTHALLRGRPEDAGELKVRCAALAAILDDPRLGKAAEQALRALGADAADGLIPLLRQGKQEHAQRRKLATLVADLAGPEHVSDLVSLLRDHDPGLRLDMARALERLTGQTQGLARTFWSGAGYERGAQAWETWLEKSAVTK